MRPKFPGTSKVGWLHNPMATRPFAGKLISGGGEALNAPKALPADFGLHPFARGIVCPTHNVMIGRSRGSTSPTDVIWVDVFIPVVSERVVKILQPFRGWSTYPVRIADCPECDHQGLSIWGRSGPTSMNTSQVEGDGPGADYVGMRIDPSSWDGSQIFYPSRGWGPLITDEVWQALTGARIGNLIFTRMDEFRYLRSSYDHMTADDANRRTSDTDDDERIRPYMIGLRSEQLIERTVDVEAIVIGRAPEDLDLALVRPGIRIILFDDVHEVDAIVQSVLPNRKFEVKPIAFGHGSIRPKSN